MLIGFATRIFRGGPTVWATHGSFSMLGERSSVRKGSFDYPCEEKGQLSDGGEWGREGYIKFRQVASCEVRQAQNCGTTLRLVSSSSAGHE